MGPRCSPTWHPVWLERLLALASRYSDSRPFPPPLPNIIAQWGHHINLRKSLLLCVYFQKSVLNLRNDSVSVKRKSEGAVLGHRLCDSCFTLATRLASRDGHEILHSWLSMASLIMVFTLSFLTHFSLVHWTALYSPNMPVLLPPQGLCICLFSFLKIPYFIQLYVCHSCVLQGSLLIKYVSILIFSSYYIPMLSSSLLFCFNFVTYYDISLYVICYLSFIIIKLTRWNYTKQAFCV